MDALANTSEGHLEVIEQLPDYAVGALDDTQMDDVARHLEECAGCRFELRQILQLLGVILEAPSLSPDSRNLMLARARGQQRQEPRPVSVQVPPSPLPHLAAAVRDHGRPVHARPWWGRPSTVVLAIAASLLIVALGIAALRPGQIGGDDAVIATIIASAPLYPLTDGELNPPASGVLFAADGDSRAVLLAEGLPSLPVDRRYQVWLFTDAGERVSGGLFTPDAGGRAEVLIKTSQPMSAYAAVAISAGPASGSAAPTSPLALGGWLE